MLDILLTILIATLSGYGFHRMLKKHMIFNWYYIILKKMYKKKLFNKANKEFFGNWAINKIDLIIDSDIKSAFFFIIGIISHFIWYSTLTFIEFTLSILAKPLGYCMICNTTWVAFIIAYYKGHNWFWIIVIGVGATGSIKLLQLVKEFIIANK